MCQQCLDACRMVFPEVPETEIGDFLISTTCYPMGSAKDVRAQLLANKAKMTTDDYHECYLIADSEMTQAMEDAKERGEW